MADKRHRASDAIDILHGRYFKGKPEMLRLIEEERANAEVARKIYELRQEAGLTQRELAKLVGTTASVICRLEDADYEGHSLAILNRVAAALGMKPRISFVPIIVNTHIRKVRSAAFTRATSKGSKGSLPPKSTRRGNKSSSKDK